MTLNLNRCYMAVWQYIVPVRVPVEAALLIEASVGLEGHSLVEHVCIKIQQSILIESAPFVANYWLLHEFMVGEFLKEDLVISKPMSVNICGSCNQLDLHFGTLSQPVKSRNNLLLEGYQFLQHRHHKNHSVNCLSKWSTGNLDCELGCRMWALNTSIKILILL